MPGTNFFFTFSYKQSRNVMINEEVTEQLDIIKINNEVLHYFLILLLLFLDSN